MGLLPERLRNCIKGTGRRDGIFIRCFLYILTDWWTGMSGPLDLLGKGSVTNCCARLISIHKGKTVKWQGQAVELTFSPGEAADALSKTLNDDVPEYIDVIMLSDNNDIWLCSEGRQWTYRPPLQEI